MTFDENASAISSENNSQSSMALLAGSLSTVGANSNLSHNLITPPTPTTLH